MTYRSRRPLRRGLLGSLIAGGVVVAGLAQAQPPSDSSATTLTEPAPAFERHGVVMVDDGMRLAILREPRLVGGTAIFRQGDRIGPFTVAEVLQDQVRLEREGDTILVPLRGSSRGTPALPMRASGAPQVEKGEDPKRGPTGAPEAGQGERPQEQRRARRQEVIRQRMERINREALEAQSGPRSFLNLLQQSPVFPQGGGVPGGGHPAPPQNDQ